MSAATAEARAAASVDASVPESLETATAGLSISSPDQASADAVRDDRYPLTVVYCKICSWPAELHEYHARAQLGRCSEWLRENAPETFPDKFPEEAAAAKAAREAAAAGGSAGPVAASADEGVKVAVPVHQKGAIGRKKKLAAEVTIQLANRKGKKVTVVYGLDLFGIKLAEAAKASKKKFASGCCVAMSADNRDVIEIQGTRQEDFAELCHKKFGVPKKAIFVIDTKRKTKICYDSDG